MHADPLLLTLKIDNKTQEYFDALRKQYFPSDRNWLDAHVMLFHQLPAGEQQILGDIADIAASTSVFEMDITSPKHIGRGVAYKIESPQLLMMHKHMQALWEQWLIPQDKHTLWPHITIQNKVDPVVAQSTLLKVSDHFEPFKAVTQGLTLWEYKGGPWEFVDEWLFKG
ncbi:2'-5' RNA ligase family protein [Mucilaginibacter sp. 21P]|uniref:2'-5' RNA ligase family protein n=1 Tax=Mucilaginibacter sp. 21P TaxID=2778902 RepID=UPI001C5A46F4|nr:2'-5' RNA ligase family protein [Mucilaginibacter sp. 21P]QXV64628.1 2'-5' RNA ligase family protein [Mucilaginibacter sp. 21P]